jgi:hypothetical protein
VIDDTGGYSVYHEYDGASDDSFSTVPAVTITSPSSATVDLASYSGNVTYTTGNREGVGIYTFEATETGTGVRRGRSRRHPAGQWRPPPTTQGGGWGAPGGAYPPSGSPAPGPPAGWQRPPSSLGPPQGAPF